MSATRQLRPPAASPAAAPLRPRAPRRPRAAPVAAAAAGPAWRWRSPDWQQLQQRVPPAKREAERSAMVNEEVVYFIFQLELDSQLQRALNYTAYEAAQQIRAKRETVRLPPPAYACMHAHAAQHGLRPARQPAAAGAAGLSRGPQLAGRARRACGAHSPHKRDPVRRRSVGRPPPGTRPPVQPGSPRRLIWRYGRCRSARVPPRRAAAGSARRPRSSP
jgi:hypothetical protein